MSPTARRTVASVLGLALVAAAWWAVTSGSGGSVGSGDGGDREAWRVTWVIDGDTVEAVRGSDTARVRLIGIDTPERDQCGYEEARAALAAAIEDAEVDLVAGATTDVDRYGRLLRYVEVDGLDVGLELIHQGFAIARYDSRTGQPHPREDSYRAADRDSRDLCG